MLVNEGAPESVYVACERIGVDPQIVVPVPKSTGLVQCERLVSATPVHRYAVLSDWSRTWIAARFPVTEPGSVRRLFVGRWNATRRRTVNFDAVRAMVESRGFVTVAMDGRSVDEQAAWFAGADVIVIEHGAALANLAFARPGTRVIELVGANTVSWMYAIGSGRAGLEYDMLLGIFADAVGDSKVHRRGVHSPTVTAVVLDVIVLSQGHRGAMVRQVPTNTADNRTDIELVVSRSKNHTPRRSPWRT